MAFKFPASAKNCLCWWFFCHFLTHCTPLKLFPSDFYKISDKIVHSISHKIFPQEFPARFFSHKNFPQDFPARISLQDFPARISQEFPARISRKIFPQEFPARPQNFPARFSRKKEFSKLDPDWLAPHYPIPNAKFPPITALLNRPTYHKRSKVSPPPFP